MTEPPDSPARFAVCINNTDYPASLELHKIYRVLPDEEAAKDGDLRVIDESGEDYLYPADFFVLIDVPKAVEQALLQPLKVIDTSPNQPLQRTGGPRCVVAQWSNQRSWCVRRPPLSGSVRDQQT